jgi:hypothetical protein
MQYQIIKPISTRPAASSIPPKKEPTSKCGSCLQVHEQADVVEASGCPLGVEFVCGSLVVWKLLLDGLVVADGEIGMLLDGLVVADGEIGTLLVGLVVADGKIGMLLDGIVVADGVVTSGVVTGIPVLDEGIIPVVFAGVPVSRLDVVAVMVCENAGVTPIRNGHIHGTFK